MLPSAQMKVQGACLSCRRSGLAKARDPSAGVATGRPRHNRAMSGVAIQGRVEGAGRGAGAGVVGGENVGRPRMQWMLW